MNRNYQNEYKRKYNQNNKIVTFPLSNAFYEELKTNSYAKNIVTTFLNNNVPNTLTQEQKEFIKEYIHISRGIANNINQIAYKSNINEVVDINILISSLKTYEDEFKKFITKV